MTRYTIRVKEVTYHHFYFDDAPSLDDAISTVYEKYFESNELAPSYSQSDGPTMIATWEYDDEGNLVHSDYFE